MKVFIINPTSSQGTSEVTTIGGPPYELHFGNCYWQARKWLTKYKDYIAILTPAEQEHTEDVRTLRVIAPNVPIIFYDMTDTDEDSIAQILEGSKQFPHMHNNALSLCEILTSTLV